MFLLLLTFCNKEEEMLVIGDGEGEQPVWEGSFEYR